MIRSYYRRLLSKIVLRSLPSDFNWTESCPMVRFDNFGQSTEILFRFLFFTSDIYCGDRLLGDIFMGGAWASGGRQTAYAAWEATGSRSKTPVVGFVR